ncbi:MAG: hypothetical protein JRD89_07910 [Deltaproteobacteria bacterium]|nr:hypothetical protein [Deltaproteobacteria bacterium]
MVELDIEQAASIVAPCFDAVRDVFVAHLVEPGVKLDLLRRTRLLIEPGAHDCDRHFAACRTDGRQIQLAPEAADLPLETLTSILAHEFGHAADFSYPAHFRLVARYEAAQWRPLPSRGAPRKVAAWQERSEDQIEWTADAIAFLVTGRQVGYCGPCMVQCWNGLDRPSGLR